MIKIFLVMACVIININAATWYVRPSGSGDANGTSYVNAWNGVNSITGISPGDTIYICGTFIGATKAKGMVDNITIRGDYPGDPGVLSTSQLWWIEGKTNGYFKSVCFSNSVVSSIIVADSLTTYMTFDSCTFTNGAQADIFYGQDHWTFKNCEFGNLSNGIYTHISERPCGPNFLVVTNCYIHDTDTLDHPDQDAHGIGLQGSSYCKIINNRIERTGSAIAFWSTSTIGLSNNVVAYNFIKDVHVCTVTIGNGIGFSHDSAGYSAANQIYGNIICNVGLLGTNGDRGFGIALNQSDYFTVYNNTISNCVRGVSSTSSSSHGRYYNNIVSAASQYSVSFSEQSSVGDVIEDYNLYWPTDNSYHPTGTHNVHSIVGNPLFASASPASALDFALLIGSPAIQAGTGVGIATDYRGFPFANPPSMGAFEFSENSSAVNATATHMSGQ